MEGGSVAAGESTAKVAAKVGLRPNGQGQRVEKVYSIAVLV